MLGMPLFASPPGTDSATLMHLGRIFAARHDALWRAPDALAWLLRCAEASAALAEGTGASQEAVHESVPPFADMQALTAMTYPPGDDNAFHDVSLVQFSEAAAVQLPPEQLHDAGVAGVGDAAHRAHAETIVGGLMAGTAAVLVHPHPRPQACALAGQLFLMSCSSACGEVYASLVVKLDTEWCVLVCRTSCQMRSCRRRTRLWLSCRRCCHGCMFQAIGKETTRKRDVLQRYLHSCQGLRSFWRSMACSWELRFPRMSDCAWLSLCTNTSHRCSSSPSHTGCRHHSRIYWYVAERCARVCG